MGKKNKVKIMLITLVVVVIGVAGFFMWKSGPQICML